MKSNVKAPVLSLAPLDLLLVDILRFAPRVHRGLVSLFRVFVPLWLLSLPFSCFIFPQEGLAAGDTGNGSSRLVAQAQQLRDTSTIVITEGIGFDEFAVGDPRCTKEFIKERLGPPERETKDALSYSGKHGLTFVMASDADLPIEIRLTDGFKGKLRSGITMFSSQKDIFKVYGEPTSVEHVDDFPVYRGDRTLYVKGNDNQIGYLYLGLRFVFAGDRIREINIVRKTKPDASQESPPVSHQPQPVTEYRGTIDTSTIVVEEGRGFDQFVVGDPQCTKQFIKSGFGRPAEETDHWLNYKPQYGLDFLTTADKDMLIEIRLNPGFRGKLGSNVSMDSLMNDVFQIYGGPVAEQSVDDLGPHFENRTLFKRGTFSKIFYNEYGMLFWFNGNRINQIVIHRKPPGSPAPPRPVVASPGAPQPLDIQIDRRYPRWGPLVRIEKLWEYVKMLWIYWYYTLAILALLLLLLKDIILRLYYRWRPLPDGRLLSITNPTGEQSTNINLWLEARRLKKRHLLIGSGAGVDIRLRHKSVDYHHALISAYRTEGGNVTYIEQMGDGQVIVNGAHGEIMPLGQKADVQIGEFRFQYERPTEYRQVQARYKDGRTDEGVPATWDINAAGFVLIPSDALSWNEAKFIRFNRLKGVYFMCDWDEDIRRELLKSGDEMRKHPATIDFTDGQTLPGYMIGYNDEKNQRFYFFPEDQSGDTVYILLERSSVKAVKQ